MKLNKTKALVTIAVFVGMLLYTNSTIYSQSEKCKKEAVQALVIVAKALQEKIGRAHV
jgi:hypothetical protein